MALRKILHSTASMSSISIIKLLAQVFVLPILARFLLPEDYGIVALAMPIVFFGLIFADAGMSQSLIKTKQYNHLEWSSCFWLMVAIGIISSILITLLGLCMSIFMGERQLFPIMAALSIIIALQSTNTVPAVSLQNQNRFIALALLEMAAVIISLTSVVVSAVMGFGAWALVIQQLSLYIVKIVLTFLVTGFVPYFKFDLNLVKSHLVFGRDILGSSLINLSKEILTNLILGKVIGVTAVGHFNMSRNLIGIPEKLCSGPMSMVLYPRFAALSDKKIDMRILFLVTTRVLASILVPLIGMLAVANQPIFNIILTEKWSVAGHIFLILAPGVIITSITGFKSNVFKVMDKSALILKFSIEQAILYLAVLSVTVWFGLYVAVIGIMVTNLLYAARPLLMVFKLLNISILEYLSRVTLPLLSACLCIVLYTIISNAYALSDLEAFALAFSLGLVALSSNVLLVFKEFVREVGLLERILKKT